MAKVICLSYGKGACRQCDDYDFCTVRQEADRLYNAERRKQEWISVDERLPNESGYFLVYIPRESAGFRVNAYYYCENETWENGNGEASSEYATLNKTTNNAKQEVARWIFLETEKVIGEQYENYVFDNRDIEGVEQDAIIAFADTMKRYFAELKKKYTEEKE